MPTRLDKWRRTAEVAQILLERNALSLLRDMSQAERTYEGRGRVVRLLPEDVPRRVRELLEAMGPTFIKVGQLLGTRPDLVPKEFVEEFRKLYDSTTPAPFPAIRAQVERETGRPLEEVFLEFREAPLASASIGQVHYARLRSGEPVAVKVQRPGIEDQVYTDFAILEPFVQFVEKLFAAARIWQPMDHFREIREMLERELDYTYEARNQQRVHDAFVDDKEVVIPKVYWEVSTKRVLVLEFIEGVKLSNLHDPQLATMDKPRIARTITRAMAKQIFEDRLFHADPSPGNLMVVEGGRVAFLDFGAVGYVTRRRGDRILRLITGFVRSDVDDVTGTLLELCKVTGPVDTRALSRDVERIMDYHERERASVADPVVFDMILRVAGEHNLLLPPDFVLITRALFQFEGICRKLDPEYELIEVLRPYVLGRVRETFFSPAHQKEALVEAAVNYQELLRDLPGRVNTILTKLEKNELSIRLEPASEGSRGEDERRLLRGTFSLIVAALIAGTAIVLVAGPSEFTSYVFVSFLFVLLWSFVMLVFAD
ncbi:MAG: ABC1 kinase family protein [Methanobacteriota archaeon]